MKKNCFQLSIKMVIFVEDTEHTQISDNITNAETVEEPIAPSEIILTLFPLSLIIISAAFGNILVIISVFTYRPLRNVQNMFIVSLTIADIGVAVLVLPLNMTYTVVGQCKLGLRLCKMWFICDLMCCTASIFNLCAIALDRYWAIHDPLNYAGKRSLKRVLLFVAGIWISSFLISVPPLLGWNEWPEEFTNDSPSPCTITVGKGYAIYSSVGSFFLPLTFMLIVYYKIFETAKQSIRGKAVRDDFLAAAKKSPVTVSTRFPWKLLRSKVSNVAITDDTTSSTDNKVLDEKNDSEVVSTSNDVNLTEAITVCENGGSGTNQTRTEQPASKDRTLSRDENPRLTFTVRHYMLEKQKICLLKERRAARVLGIVMGVFILCWSPFFLMYLTLTFCEHCYVSNHVNNFITFLAYANSACNPIIYTVFNLDFRRAFGNILCKKIR